MRVLCGLRAICHRLPIRAPSRHTESSSRKLSRSPSRQLKLSEAETETGSCWQRNASWFCRFSCHACTEMVVSGSSGDQAGQMLPAALAQGAQWERIISLAGNDTPACVRVQMRARRRSVLSWPLVNLNIAPRFPPLSFRPTGNPTGAQQ